MGQAVGGGCESDCRRLLSLTNAVEAGICRKRRQRPGRRLEAGGGVGAMHPWVRVFECPLPGNHKTGSPMPALSVFAPCLPHGQAPLHMKDNPPGWTWRT